MTDPTPAVEAKDCTKRTSDGEVMADALYAVHVEPPHDGLTNREEAEVIVQLLADAGYVLTPVQPVTETTDLRAAAQDALDCMEEAWPERPATQRLRAALAATPDAGSVRLYEVSLVEDTQANRDAGSGYIVPTTDTGSDR